MYLKRRIAKDYFVFLPELHEMKLGIAFEILSHITRSSTISRVAAEYGAKEKEKKTF